MKNLKDRYELLGEPKMSRKEFDRIEAEEKAYRKQDFTLSLSADELDWLLYELRRAAFAYRAHQKPSEALDVEHAIRAWTAQVQDQGYRG